MVWIMEQYVQLANDWERTDPSWMIETTARAHEVGMDKLSIHVKLRCATPATMVSS